MGYGQQAMGGDGYGGVQGQGQGQGMAAQGGQGDYGGLAQENWDMPQGQDIEDWDQGDQGQAQAQAQGQGQAQMGMGMGMGMQQGGDEQGGYQPQDGGDDGAMGMQTW